MESTSLPESVQRVLDGELTGGEAVRWVGRPRPPQLTLPWGGMLFGLVFLGFGIHWTQGAMESGGGGFFALFGLVPICAGLGMLASPFLLWRRIRQSAQNTAYAITDRRAIIVGSYRPEHMALVAMGFPVFMLGSLLNNAGGPGLTSYEPEMFDEIHRQQHADGLGDVLFRKELLGRSVHSIGFFSVSNAREAESLLIGLAASARQG